MKREILISGSQRETRVAILEDDRLVELLVDRPDARRSVGDIYLGKVEAVLPGIQAAFLNIGAEKSAFLHASDLIESEDEDEPGEPEDVDDEPQNGDGAGNGDGAPQAQQQPQQQGGRGRNGGGGGGRRGRRPLPNIQDELKRGQTKLVQVIKEPISTKGPRVTAQLSLPGRFLVYMPYASKVGVSRKIENREQRAKLREMVSRLVPKDEGGWIIRTVADDLTEESCKREIDHLVGLWKKIVRKSKSVRAPALVQRETSLTRGIVRDLFSDKVDGLLVDSKQLYNEIEQYLGQIDPELLGRVKLYQDEAPLFDEYDIETEIRGLFTQRVDLPTGGYIIIQPTEALVSIDVNTGRYTGKKDPESTILRTNLEAAREVARQLRLRDVGGIIVVDFIDMETRGNRDKVLHELRTHLGRDRARTKAYAVSELGLIEMTRQRVRPSLWQSMTAECPTCSGTGRVFRPEVVVRRMERSLKRAGADHKERQLAVRLHPEVAIYLVEQEPNFLRQLEKQTGLQLEVRDDPMMRLDEFRMMAKPAGRDVTEQYAVA
ncbi:MAG TPA: Rne/Rng family ribonuclease [Gemmatimonadales bacterium]|nr:Rne/Rng family ribonuclease [Gemmatimonadales bacterium]